MGSRVQLHNILKGITNNVYFQPPGTQDIHYPCVIYTRSMEKKIFANDKPYNTQLGYTLIIIDANPDSLLPSKVSELPMCKFDRGYRSNNLNHFVYNLYY